ncbi:MAG: hypothetical protein ACYDHW_08145 [Syntrophorhabdaceae bacterium]
MGSIFKQRNNKTGWESKNYYIKYYRHGKPYVECTKSSKIGDAERLLKLRQGQIVEGKFPGLQAEKTGFEDLETDLINDYKINERKSLTRVEISLAHLRKHFNRMRANEITTNYRLH